MQSVHGTIYSFLAILAGFLTIAALTAVATIMLRRFAPELDVDSPNPSILAMSSNLGITFLFSAIGGYVTAFTAGNAAPIVHTLMLGLVILLLSALAAIQMGRAGRLYYQLLLTALPPIAVLIGGLARLYQMGIRG